MRDSFKPNVRLATNILMVVGTFLIAFNLSKISTVDRDQQIKEDCSRVVAGAMTDEEFVKKYKLDYENEEFDATSFSYRKFCTQYMNPYRL